MPAGLEVQLGDINKQSGMICRDLTHSLNKAMAMKLFLDRFTAQDLVTLYGFALADANIIKSAFTELAQVNASFQANRSFINQLNGMGDVQ